MERCKGQGGPARGLVSGSYSRPRLDQTGQGPSGALGLALGSPNRKAGAGRAGVGLAIHQVEGDLKHGGPVAGHGPAAHPATVLVVVHADHLIQVLITGEVNTVTLMEGHRLAE